MNSVTVEETKDGDHYDPNAKAVRLTADKYGGKSLTAITVAAHEVGHALQDHEGYKPLRYRSNLVRVTQKFEKLGAAILMISPFIGAITRAPGLGIVMFLGGLWHGAAWTFVLWGLYHGFLLIIYHSAESLGLPRLPKPAAVCTTFLAVIGGWVLFRADSVGMATSLLGSMLALNGVAATPLTGIDVVASAQIGLALGIVFLAPNVSQIEPRIRPSVRNAVGLGMLMATCVLRFAEPSPFLYFQF